MKKGFLLFAVLSVFSLAGLEDMRFDIKTGVSGRYLYKDANSLKNDGSNEARVDYAIMNFNVPSSKLKLNIEAYSKEKAFTDFSLDNLNASMKLDYETPELAKNYSMFFATKFTLAPSSSQGKVVIEAGNNHYLPHNLKMYYSIAYESHMVYQPNNFILKYGLNYSGDIFSNNTVVKYDILLGKKPVLKVSNGTTEKEVSYKYKNSLFVENSGTYNFYKNMKFKHKVNIKYTQQEITNANELLIGAKIVKIDKKFIERGLNSTIDLGLSFNKIYNDLFINLNAKTDLSGMLNNLKKNHLSKIEDNKLYYNDDVNFKLAKYPFKYSLDLGAKIGYPIKAGELVTITPALNAKYKLTNSVNQLLLDTEATLVAKPIDHLTLELKANVPVAFTFAEASKKAMYSYTGFGAGASIKYSW